ATIVTAAVLAIGGGAAYVVKSRAVARPAATVPPTSPAEPRPASVHSTVVDEREAQGGPPALLPIGERPMGNDSPKHPEVMRRSRLVDPDPPRRAQLDPDPAGLAPGPVTNVDPTTPQAEPRSDRRP